MSTEAFQAVGRTLGRYRILDGLALGGMAEIYLARVVDSDPPEHVVIKQMQPHLAADAAFVQSFLNEARLAARLEHAHIGRVYDQGEAQGLYYFAMEYLHGYDTRALLDNALRKKQRIPLQHALCIVAKVADALQYAHEKRDAHNKPLHIVHRDVSPSNIFVTYDGQVKLVDFGLARVASDSQKYSKQSRPTTVKGKAAYLSPEQCLGHPLDRLSDIFSLGIVLYELTTGTRLFRRQETDSAYTIMNRITQGDVPLPSSVVENYPRTLQEVVLQALHLDRRRRHPTARALMLDIEAVARTEGMTLSTAELASYLEDAFGRKSLPWQDLPEDDDPLDLSSLSAADIPGDDVDEDEDDGPAEDEFDEEVATSLYTGNIDDIKNAWAAEALSVGGRPSVSNIQTRASSMRLSLPLTAEDSDEFENPLLEVSDQDMAHAQADPAAGRAASPSGARRAPTHPPAAYTPLPPEAGSSPGSRLTSDSGSGPNPLFDRRQPSHSDVGLLPVDSMGGLATSTRLPSVPPVPQQRQRVPWYVSWFVVLVIAALMAGLVAAVFYLP